MTEFAGDSPLLYRLHFLTMATALLALTSIESITQAAPTKFTVPLRANYEFNILGNTPLNPGPETGYIPFVALGEFTFELDPSINDPSKPTTVSFKNVTGKLPGTAPAQFLPHYITPEVRFVGGQLTNIVRDANGDVVSAQVKNLEMQWEMVGLEGGPLVGLHLVTGGSDFDANSNLPFDGDMHGLPFAVGDVLKGPDIISGGSENFHVYLGNPATGAPQEVNGRLRTLTVVPEPSQLGFLGLGCLAAMLRRVTRRRGSI
jgi:hypothetical protein